MLQTVDSIITGPGNPRSQKILTSLAFLEVQWRKENPEKGCPTKYVAVPLPDLREGSFVALVDCRHLPGGRHLRITKRWRDGRCGVNLQEYPWTIGATLIVLVSSNCVEMPVYHRSDPVLPYERYAKLLRKKFVGDNPSGPFPQPGVHQPPWETAETMSL